MMTITIDINGVLMDSIHVQRMTPKRHLSMPFDENVECLYKVTVRKSRAVKLHTVHRYGNGARSLAQQVLNQLALKG